jgi:hypothetical protein
MDHKAWELFFSEKNVVNEINNNGYFHLTADELKEVTKKEPRLLAKQDTLETRPDIFKENYLVIFPVRNGEYIIFRDRENKSYFRFAQNELDLPIETYNSTVDLHRFDSFPQSQAYTESQAIDFAYISSLLRTITNQPDLNLVIRGRSHSHEFSFTLPETNYKAMVSSVQIEVDAGYEGENSIILIEAKIGTRSNFHIRQLYYPYLEWSIRSRKRIVPIFLSYSNSRYYFYEFAFSDNFGEVNIVQQKCIAVNESPIANIKLRSLYRSVSIAEEASPFPQANDLNKVIDLVGMVGNGLHSKQEFASAFEFDDRQGDYYANAARYLGFLEKSRDAYVLSDIGRTLLNTMAPSERTLILIKQLSKRPVFRQAIQLLADRELNVENIQESELASIIEANTELSGTTPARRASTVKNWLHWITRNGQLTI